MRGVLLMMAAVSGLAMPVAQAALVDRGGGLIYDTDLNITWLQDANYARTSGYDADGRMSWANAKAWAENLVYGGFDDWRLPTVGPVGGEFNYNFSNNGTTDLGYGITSPNSELAYMYYVNLGNLGICAPNNSDPTGCVEQPGWGLMNTGPFTNLQSNVYWSGTEYAPNPSFAWFFDAVIGRQVFGGKINGFYAWAVRPGDVTDAPLPAAAWLLLSGIGGLGLLSRRRAGRAG
jgi:hypothetical protein